MPVNYNSVQLFCFILQLNINFIRENMRPLGKVECKYK